MTNEVKLHPVTGEELVRATYPRKVEYKGLSKNNSNDRMEQSIDEHPNITWISKVAMGNHWFWENTSQVDALDRDTVIIYEMGVNDLDAGECVEVLQYLREMGFNHVYFTGATPVNESKGFSYGYSRTNEQIRPYNYEVYCNLPEGVAMMDCYNYLINMGFSTTDGIHYTSDTYQMWFDNIMASL